MFEIMLLERFQGKRLNLEFLNLNLGSAVEHIGVLNDLIKGVNMQLIAVPKLSLKHDIPIDRLVLLVFEFFVQTEVEDGMMVVLPRT
jgi:hypothetical protein